MQHYWSDGLIKNETTIMLQMMRLTKRKKYVEEIVHTVLLVVHTTNCKYVDDIIECTKCQMCQFKTIFVAKKRNSNDSCIAKVLKLIIMRM